MVTLRYHWGGSHKVLKSLSCGWLAMVIGGPYCKDLPRVRTLGIFISQLKFIRFILEWRENLRSTASGDKDIIVINILTTEM